MLEKWNFSFRSFCKRGLLHVFVTFESQNRRRTGYYWRALTSPYREREFEFVGSAPGSQRGPQGVDVIAGSTEQGCSNMVRQLRAEATRAAALRAAADLFLDVGHANATLSQVSAQSGVTKGALYFHFASKEELARAIVDEGHERVSTACAGLVDSRSPALESVIGISYSVLELAASDPLVRVMYRLQMEIDGSDTARGSVFGTWGNIFEHLFERRARRCVRRRSTRLCEPTRS